MLGKQRKGWVAAAMLALALIVVTACSGGGSGGSGSGDSGPTATKTPAPAATATPQAEAPEAPIELLWLSFDPPEADGTPVQKYLEEKFNVKIENMRVDRASWREHLNIRLATKEIPDLFFMFSGDEILEYSNQGLLAELPHELIKAKMPGYAASVDALDPSLWNNTVVNGKNFAIPLYWLEGATPFLPAYNGDWLKAIGFDKPPETLEQFEKLVYAFANDDPDGDGKADTIGYTGRGKDSIATQAFNTVFSAFGTNPSAWLEGDDGQLAYGITTERAREALKLLNKWYKDGVIDKEFITADYAKLRQDLANGRSGVFESGMWNSYAIAIEPEFKGQNPNTELVIGKPLIGPHGDNAGFSWGIKNNFVGMGVQVASDAKKMDKIFEILEALATDEEVYKTTLFGIEGQHYDVVDGVPVPHEQYVNTTERSAKIGAGFYYNVFGTKSSYMAKFDLPKAQQEFKAKATAGVPAYNSKLTFIAPEAANYPDLNTIRDEYLVKFIIGEVDLDQGFDNFVKLWMSSGGAELTKVINERYAALK